MSLTTVSTGNTIAASNVNQLVNVLQQPSSGQEKGKYILQAGLTSSGFTSKYTDSLSRNATPVSVTIDTADTAPTNLSTPTTLSLTANGFLIHATASSTNSNCTAGGNYTIQY